jgi:diacylglycerol kinase
MNNKKFPGQERISSFIHAFNGLKIVFHDEPNARIHLIAAICVIAAGILFRLSTVEWLAVLFAAGFVIVLEIMNSSLEKLADFVSPGMNDTIKKVKDLAAAGVLVSAITAFITGLIVFLPKIIHLF